MTRDEVMQRLREGVGPDKELCRALVAILKYPHHAVIPVGDDMRHRDDLLDPIIGPGIWSALWDERFPARRYCLWRGDNFFRFYTVDHLLRGEHTEECRCRALAMLEALSHG